VKYNELAPLFDGSPRAILNL